MKRYRNIKLSTGEIEDKIQEQEAPAAEEPQEMCIRDRDGEIALGKNPLIGFMTWEGYNYEDAVLLSERLVRDDVYTSVHIEEYEACLLYTSKTHPDRMETKKYCRFCKTHTLHKETK